MGLGDRVPREAGEHCDPAACRGRHRELAGCADIAGPTALHAIVRQDSPEQPADGDDRDQHGQERPARLQHELVVDILDGVEADQRQQQAEGNEARPSCVLQGADCSGP
jgi:hypothetical protein